MNKKDAPGVMDRRKFIKLLAATAFTGQTLACGEKIRGEKLTETDTLDRRHEVPSMTYRKLGKTNFMSSRLVFGCGAALEGGKAERLLERAFEAGINHFDEGSNLAYPGSERNLAPFLKKYRDKVWVASKAPVLHHLRPEDSITVEEAKYGSQKWMQLLEASLKELDIDYIDAYYVMKVNNPTLIRSEEMYNAFLNAKKAGKVRYFGLSTHMDAQQVLEAAIETGWYDMAMIAITPAGWYDWDKRNILRDTPTLIEIAPFLKRARNAGIGLIGMKAVRHLAPMSAMGSDDTTAFDKFYDEKFKASPLTPFQRSYAYVLEHGIDVVNADMHNFQHLEENIVAASTSHTYFS